MDEKLQAMAVARNMVKVAYGLPLTTLPHILVIMDHHLIITMMMMMINMIQSAIG